jgi:regulator of nonsense transcripts 2
MYISFNAEYSTHELIHQSQGSGDDEPTARILSDDEDEQIVVTRQEDERDPEADAEFDRELAKLMTESAESRKFERKPVFDVPLPMRRAREAAVNPEDGGGEVVPAQVPTMVPSRADPVPTMKFSLLSKRGNKQQTRSIDLPSDSTFAVAMRSKQQAEKEEQQRIKNLVLNYELRDDNDTEGTLPFLYHLHPNPNKKKRAETTEGLDKTHNPYAQPRLDKAGNNRSHQRARKLQLSDVNWYDTSFPSQPPRVPSRSASSDATPNGGAVSSLVIPVQKKSHRKVK